jgi:hypothetical protein
MAHEWLLLSRNDEAAQRYFGETLEEKGPGRPEIGPSVRVRFPNHVIAQLDDHSESEGVPRAELIRQLVIAGLASR